MSKVVNIHLIENFSFISHTHYLNEMERWTGLLSIFIAYLIKWMGNAQCFFFKHERDKYTCNTRALLIKRIRGQHLNHPINYLKRSQNHNKTASKQMHRISCTQLSNNKKNTKCSHYNRAILNAVAFFFLLHFFYCCIIISGTKSKVNFF